MHTIIRLPKLFFRYLRISTINLFQFPFEVLMKFIDLLFSILFLYAFWYSLNKVGVIIPGWNEFEVMILAGTGMISSGIAQIAFGFRDMEYLVLNGSLDKYLVRPIYPLLSIVFEKLFIFWIVFQCISGVGIICIAVHQGGIILRHIIPATITIILGTFAYQFVFGCFTLLTFWIGRVNSARSMIFSISEAKKYPLDIFPTKVYNIFIWLLPIGFLATIPAKIILGKIEHPWQCVINVCLIFIFWAIILNFTWKRAIKRYESTGS